MADSKSIAPYTETAILPLAIGYSLLGSDHSPDVLNRDLGHAI